VDCFLAFLFAFKRDSFPFVLPILTLPLPPPSLTVQFPIPRTDLFLTFFFSPPWTRRFCRLMVGEARRAINPLPLCGGFSLRSLFTRPFLLSSQPLTWGFFAGVKGAFPVPEAEVIQRGVSPPYPPSSRRDRVSVFGHVAFFSGDVDVFPFWPLIQA